ncbi:aminoglycoside phosphotransferase family protein [Dictyobacter formicarum]|uniref:Aminoglycoside phosphotransferase domain-containing protein n=1 Tax=Dictyobacter formicarum TaxID=2778368 RepID=A0ABQ3VC60_9CHLR|nr:aminoglycoside phosphotransferase family protein [Dictyobacter formicarum]GHO83742.1 hypothetical protein KSZ_17480 [Dictyobacter formicarum]
MEIQKLVQEINDCHQTEFVLRKRYANGEQGAFELCDASSGACYVLKCFAPAVASQRTSWIRTCTDQLRLLGYPVPQYVLWGEYSGGSFSIQTALPGAPIIHATPEQLPRLIELNEMQRNQLPDTASTWPDEIVRTVLVGGSGYCLHDSLRTHTSATAAMLRTLQDLVVRQRECIIPTTDIVHYDFQPYNILGEQQEISGIIDWEGVCAGDCTFDLVTLLFYNYDDTSIRASLWDYLSVRSTIQVVSIYLAHLILRQVDWSLRFHDTATSQLYIDRAEAILHYLKPALS